MRKLTQTQADLLAVLRAIRSHSDRTEADDNARAIGGLTPLERFQRGAVSCRGTKALIARGTGTIAIAYNVKVSTFLALEKLGLLERQGHLVRAVVVAATDERAEQKALIASMVRDVEDGIRVLNTRCGYTVAETDITERARNIVTGLIGNYVIKAAPPVTTPLGPGPCPTGHPGALGVAGEPWAAGHAPYTAPKGQE